MELEEADSRGCFKAHGKGFVYAVDPAARFVSIALRRDQSPLLTLSIDRRIASRAGDFLKFLERCTQIKALVFSNNHTIDLSETFDNDKLKILLQATANLALYTFDLYHGKYRSFERRFCRQFGILSFSIRKITGKDMEDDFYVARLETLRKSGVDCRQTTLYSALISLSEKILHDLIVRELSMPTQGAAYSLLKISAEVATIAQALNPEFIPAQKVITEKTRLQRISNANEKNITNSAN
ncbi:MAG: hypothetical protein L6Q57_08330 [Alphaproteobacteria bacterium]|nr:hypothetical protein [Alphaproteobacteria bacterium]